MTSHKASRRRDNLIRAADLEREIREREREMMVNCETFWTTSLVLSLYVTTTYAPVGQGNDQQILFLLSLPLA